MKTLSRFLVARFTHWPEGRHFSTPFDNASNKNITLFIGLFNGVLFTVPKLRQNTNKNNNHYFI
ncbi:MAG: hypothetical protein FWH16_05650, partial [Oscillospiraceae bacterium]|nr:hypothetical protein [Oscillospiraceae bacterium]